MSLSAICTSIYCQDTFGKRSSSYNFQVNKRSNYFRTKDITRISLYNDITKKVDFSFELNNNTLFKYVYTDTNKYIGHLEPLIMGNKNDFNFVCNIALNARADCKSNYKMYKASAAGTLFLTILTPIAGLACAIPASTTTPRIANLGFSDIDMLNDDIYFQVYSQEARKIKSKKNWINFGIGFGIHVGLLFGVLALTGVM